MSEREQAIRDVGVAMRRSELHSFGCDDERVDAVDADEAMEAYEWDDALCPACGSFEDCGCDELAVAAEARRQIDESINRDRAIRAENTARFPDSTARRRLCNACKKGEHIDHQRGVWRKFDGSDPVVCPCETCGDVGSQGVLFG